MNTRTMVAVALVLAFSMVLVSSVQAAVVGTEDFGYADGNVAGQVGGTGFDWDNVADSHTTTVSDWDNVSGSPQIVGGALVTNGNSAKREYNGPGEGTAAGSDERNGALQNNGIVYYRTQYTQNAAQSWSGMSSYDFNSERLFFGQTGGQGATPYFGVNQSGVGSTLSTVPVVVGQTYDLVAELNFNADAIRLWVDPTTNPDPVATRRYTGTNWSTAVRLGSGGQTTWDDLTVTSSWADLGLAPATGLLVDEPLDGYTTGALSGQTIEGTGFSPDGTWTGSGATVTSSGGLTYGVLQTSGGLVTTTNSGGGVQGVLDTGVFDQAGLTGSDGFIGGSDVEGTLYYSFLGQRVAPTTSAAGNTFAAVELYRGGTEVLGVGNNWPAAAFSTFGITGSADLNSPNSDRPNDGWENVDNDIHLFVVRLDFHDGLDDDVTVWMDPDLSLDEADQPALLMTEFLSIGDAAFNHVRFRSGNAGRTWNWDELRFGTTWDSVLPVPEPSTWVLALLGLVGLVVLRRRRP